MKAYIKSFFSDGKIGIETIEFIGLVVVAAVLIGLVASIGTTMAGRANTAQGQMEDALDALDEIANGSTGNNAGTQKSADNNYGVTDDYT